MPDKKTISNNTSLYRKTKKAVVATSDKLIYAFILAFLIFVANFINQILIILDEGSYIPSGTTSMIIADELSLLLSRLSEAPYADDVAGGLAFAGVAAAIYFSYSFIGNSLIILKNEVVVDTNYGQIFVIKKIVQGLAKKILPVVFFILLLVVSWLYLAGYWISLLKIFVFSGMSWQAAHFFALGLIGLAINIYIILAVAHFIWLYEEEV